MIQITIDGKIFSANKQETILDVAKREKIKIPTLCYTEWSTAYGGCRICSVEVTKESWKNWRKMVTACNYPVEEGIIIYTNSERVIHLRKTLLDLLLARCPNTPLVQKLAGEYGIYKTSYIPREKPDDCILCGLCVRACEAIGAKSITTTFRGIEKVVNTPFGEANNECIGCSSCAEVCPTHCIQYTQDKTTRHIWHKDFRLVRCVSCGRAHITEEQLNHFIKKTGLSRSYFEKCELCHKKETAQTFKTIQV